MSDLYEYKIIGLKMIKLNFKSINILRNIHITELLIRLMDMKIEVKSIINPEFNAWMNISNEWIMCELNMLSSIY